MPRMSIYVSDRRDVDIINALVDIPEGDRSWYLKELIRDGLRYRNGIEPPGNVQGRSTQVILPGAPPIEPKQVTPKTPKKVKKEETTTEQEVIVKEVPVINEVKSEPEPIVENTEVKKEPVIDTNVDFFANINLEALKKAAEDEFDDDELDERLDSL